MAQNPGDSSSKSSDGGWTRLFDGRTLDGWYTFFERQKKNEDPTRVFQVHDGMIHIYKDQDAGSAVPGGYIATEAEYSNYDLRLEYKWGEKKFKPRVQARRDTGLLYHVVGPDLFWPRCIECQIQEGDAGDCFTVRGTRVVASVEIAEVQTPTGPKNLPRYLPEADGGKLQTIGHGSIARIVKSDTNERDGWNAIEVRVRGGEQAMHIVNGHTVFQAKDLQQLESPPNPTPVTGTEAGKMKWSPLTQGRIALQAEFAEVYYRNVEIRPFSTGVGSK
jgi:hypothetical protein